MTKCNTIPIPFTSCKRRLVQASFSGGDITSDGGSVLLREMDRHLKLTSSLAQMLDDGREKEEKTQFNVLQLIFRLPGSSQNNHIFSRWYLVKKPSFYNKIVEGRLLFAIR